MHKNNVIPIFLFISLFIGLFIVFPTAKATSYEEKIINGGFETGTKTGWNGTDYVAQNSTILTDSATLSDFSLHPYNGVYCWAGYDGGYINQTVLSIAINVSQVYSFTFQHIDKQIAAYIGGLSCDVYYSDSSHTHFDVPVNMVWILADYSSSLTPNKIISNIVFSGNGGLICCIDDVSLIVEVSPSSYHALVVNSNINSYFTMNGSILSTEFGVSTPYSNVSVPEAYYAFTRLNSSLGAYNFSHWYVQFTDNGSQAIINSTSTFIIINLNANLTVWLIYASTSVVILPEFHIPFLVPLLIQILDLLFSFGAMGYLYRESRSAKTGLRAFILIMLIFMLMITIFLAANVLYGFG